MSRVENNIGEHTRGFSLNPSSPERFLNMFSERGLLQPPPDYQYWMSYNHEFATNV